MADTNFVKNNLVLIIGLVLPILLMIGFMVVSTLPASGEPPKYSLLFSTSDYRHNQSLPIAVNLVVKEGALVAQYSKIPAGNNAYANYWRKLYLFDAQTQRVRELEFGLPEQADQISGMREDPVKATLGMKISTDLKSPDGYELSDRHYRHGGLFNELFFGWGSGTNSTMISNGSRSIKLTPDDGRTYIYSGQAQFIGWVIQ